MSVAYEEIQWQSSRVLLPHGFEKVLERIVVDGVAYRGHRNDMVAPDGTRVTNARRMVTDDAQQGYAVRPAEGGPRLYHSADSDEALGWAGNDCARAIREAIGGAGHVTGA